MPVSDLGTLAAGTLIPCRVGVTSCVRHTCSSCPSSIIPAPRPKSWPCCKKGSDPTTSGSLRGWHSPALAGVGAEEGFSWPAAPVQDSSVMCLHGQGLEARGSVHRPLLVSVGQSVLSRLERRSGPGVLGWKLWQGTSGLGLGSWGHSLWGPCPGVTQSAKLHGSTSPVLSAADTHVGSAVPGSGVLLAPVLGRCPKDP